MTFVHDNAEEFADLLTIVAGDTGIAEALVEKDYWITHCLWALHQTGLELWFKGGTSLSKGFGLIERFSEDLDLMVEHGSVEHLPPVFNWTSTNKGPVAQRRAFYDALASSFVIPAVNVTLDTTRYDKHARAADYIARYPGGLVGQLPTVMSPFVRFEVGRARVVPFVEVSLSSFVHDYLEREHMMDEYLDNRPTAVRCVHPLVTLLEKLDALSRRFVRDQMESDSFVRHYEDAAQIVRSVDGLPVTEMTTMALAHDMLEQKDIAALPNPDDLSLVLSDASKRADIENAYEKISPMFWGPRIPLDKACAIVRAWLRQLRA
jgi:hypothetical protein